MYFLSYDTLPTIDASSYHMIHHLSSMHNHVKKYFKYHLFMFMLYFISPNIDSSLSSYINYCRCIIKLYDTSPSIDAWLYHIIHHLPSCDTSLTIDACSCLKIFFVLLILGHVIRYITYRHDI